MVDILIEILETFGYDVFKQGSLTEDDPYPDSFFTFWNNDSYDGNHYDNDALHFIWNFDVMFYSVDPALVNSILSEVRKRLRARGFIVSGQGFDVASDEPTHTGRGITALYMQKNKED